MNFGETKYGCENSLATFKPGSHNRAPFLVEIPLGESRGIQIQHHSLSSKIICETGLPFTCMGLNRLNGRVPRRKWPSASSRFRISSKPFAAPDSGLGGTMC